MTDYPRPTAQLHLNLFKGYNFSPDWGKVDPLHDYYSFESYLRIVRKAEEGLFSAVFLGETLRVREHLERINELYVLGRPDSLVLHAYLAAHTSRIGLVSTLNTTFNDPDDLAARLGTVEALSSGRTGWNIVTTHNAWLGENFRQGGYLDHSERYRRADWFAETVHRTLSLADGHHGADPQGSPVYFQAGDSREGRDFAARWAEGVYTHHADEAGGISYTADLRRRARSYGRPGDDIKIFPGASIVLGDSDEEAFERQRHHRERTLTDAYIRQAVEVVWATELPELDLDGPLPSFDPVRDAPDPGYGIVYTSGQERGPKARGWRALAEERGFSVRELISHLHVERGFVGTASGVAERLAHLVRSDAFDGINVHPVDFPEGIDDIVEQLVPALQERGAYPGAYRGATLRQNLGLPRPVPDRVGELRREALGR